MRNFTTIEKWKLATDLDKNRALVLALTLFRKHQDVAMEIDLEDLNLSKE